MCKKLIKRVLCGSLAFLMAVSAVACSDKTSTSKTDNETKTVTTAEDQSSETEAARDESKELVTLEWLTYQYAPVDETSPIKKKLEEMFNVKFNIWYIDVTKREELLGTRLASGQIPDFMTVYSDSDLLKFTNQGIIQTITKQEVEQYLPTWKSYVDSYDPKIWTYSEYNGEYMGIPNVNTDGIYNKAVAWNKEWLENVGITKVPTTLEEFEEAMYKFRNNDPDKNGKKDTYGMSSTAMMNIYGAFSGYVGPPLWWGVKDGKLLPYALFPETKKALEVLRKWKQDDVIDPEWVTGENKGGYWALSHAFLNGRIGVSSSGESYHWTPRLYEGGWEGQNAEQLRTLSNDKYHIVFGPPPKGPEGKFGNILGGVKSPTYMAIGKNADEVKKHRILTIWNTIYSDYDLWKFVRHGEKDVHYIIKDDGITVEQKEGFKTADEMAKIGAHITFAPFGYLPFTQKETRPEGREFNDKNFKWEGAGYENMLKVALPSDPKYTANLEKLIQETFTAIINSEEDLSYFDTFVEEFNKNGGEQLIKEANEWYSSLSK